MIIYICTLKILKTFKTGFSVHNIHLYLCYHVENAKWILNCRKIVLNVQYLRFLMYNVYFQPEYDYLELWFMLIVLPYVIYTAFKSKINGIEFDKIKFLFQKRFIIDQ